MVTVAERAWQMRRLGTGDYLLLSNDRRILWRFRKYEERDGTLTTFDGKVIDGDFWALLRYHRDPFDLEPEEIDRPWNEELWVRVSSMLTTRQAAIAEALAYEPPA